MIFAILAYLLARERFDSEAVGFLCAAAFFEITCELAIVAAMLLR